jgi:hypothetical protein
MSEVAKAPCDVKAGTDALTAVNSSNSGQGARLQALVALKRKALKTEQKEKKDIEEKTTETWSGLRIVDRDVRQEKWDLSMRGKALLTIASLDGADLLGRDQVLIGVLCSSQACPKHGPDNRVSAEWTLTDLDIRNPQKVSLMLAGRALEHWAKRDGAGRKQATLGSIIAVLNPSLTGRAKTLRIGFESQILRLGRCPAFAMCKAKTADGLACNEPYNSENGCEYCLHHSTVSHGARQHNYLPTSQMHIKPHVARLPAASAETSRPVASPLSRLTTPSPSGNVLAVLQRAEIALDTASRSGRGEELLNILKELEATKVDGLTLSHSRIYDRVGMLAQGQDAGAILAKSLRRKWRILMDDAKSSLQIYDANGGKQQLAKRPRMGM